MKVTHVRRKVMLSALAGAIMIPGSTVRVKAAEGKNESTSLLPIAGIESVLTECLETNVKDNINLYLIPTSEGEYLNRAFSNVNDFSYVRNAPNEESEWTGKLYDDSTVTVLQYKGDWTKIRSGNVEGYVPADSLYTGEEAKKHAKEYETDVVTVLADVLNVRSGQGTENDILTQVMFRQQYEVTGEPENGWYPVKVEGFDGWVCGDYVEAETTFSYAESKEEEEHRLARGETVRQSNLGKVQDSGTQESGTTAAQPGGTTAAQTGENVGAQAGGITGIQAGRTTGTQTDTASETLVQANGTAGAQTDAATGIQAGNGAAGGGTGDISGTEVQVKGTAGAQAGTGSSAQTGNNAASGAQTGNNAASGAQTGNSAASGAQTGNSAAATSQPGNGGAAGTQTGGSTETQAQVSGTARSQAGSTADTQVQITDADGNQLQADSTAEVQEAAAMQPQQYAGQAVIDFACQFIGNPYVWGGTSLTNGADCSGFVQSVYANFGIALPRTTWDMVNVGYEVSYDQALPGDLVLYDGHVGIYMGDGTIVNAMNEAQGIGICTATYAPIITIRRVL